jgi:hypothetical protein
MILFFPLGILMMWLYAPWRNRFKWMWTGIAAFLALIVVAGAASGGGGNKSDEARAVQGATVPAGPTSSPEPAKLTNTPEPAEPTSTPKPAKPTSTPKPAKPTNKVAGVAGAVAEAEDVRVTLNQVVDPWVSDNQFEQPDAGKRFVAFDVTIENVGGSGTHYASPINFKLTDSESFAYEITFFGPDPALRTTGLGSGEKTRGWVPFEVNQNASLAVLKYDPNMFTTDDIEFQFP